MSQDGFKLEDVSFAYQRDREKRVLLKQVSAHFAAGTLSVINGSIGAGKSTLLHLLAGFYRPNSGVVYAGRDPISRWTTYHRDRWRRNAGVVLQSGGLIDDLSVRENLLLPLIPRGFKFRKITQRVTGVLEAFEISHLAEKNILSLSGGERQRCAMALALIGHPKYILADEPTAHQDADGFSLVLDHLCEAARDGSTIVVASHDSRLSASAVNSACYQLAKGTLERVK